MKKRLLSSLLLCFFLVGLLSCSDRTGAGTDVTVGESVKMTEIILGENNGFDYRIIIPEAYKLGEGLAANTLATAIYRISGGFVNPVDDFLGKGKTEDPGAREIVLGPTNRAISGSADAKLQCDKDYVIFAEGNKIAIYSRDSGSLSEAVNYFSDHISNKDGKIVLSIEEECYSSFDYPAKDMKISGRPISDFVIAIPAGSSADRSAADSVNKWLLDNVGITLGVNTDDKRSECEILIGDTDREESAKYYAGEKALAAGAYAIATEGTKLVLAYNGFGGIIARHFTEYADENHNIENLSIVSADSAIDLFRTDNYAAGRWSDELWNSATPGVLAILSECTYFQDQLLAGIKRGEKWVYSNSSTYVPQNGYFDDMVKSGKRGANCAMPQAWIFTELRILPSGHMYGNSSGEINNIGTHGKYVCAVATITKWGGKYEFNQLYAKGKIKAGDIFFCKGHTFIYLGDEIFMAAGHEGEWHTDSSANTEDERKAVFESWFRPMKSCADYNYDIYYQVRFKDEFVPMYYRNAAGKLVKNPMYDESTSIYYKKGVSDEKYSYITGTLG